MHVKCMEVHGTYNSSHPIILNNKLVNFMLGNIISIPIYPGVFFPVVNYTLVQ